MVRQIGPMFGTPRAAALEQRILDLERRIAVLEIRLAAVAGEGRDGLDGHQGPDGHRPAIAVGSTGVDGARSGSGSGSGVGDGSGAGASRSRPHRSARHDAVSTAARVAAAAARASAAARTASSAARFAQTRGAVISLRPPQPESPSHRVPPLQ